MSEEDYGEENITQGKESFSEIHDEENSSESIQETQIPEEELEEYTSSQISKGIRRPTKYKSLSDKDLFRRTSSIFEQVKDIKINLKYTRDNNMVYPTSNYNDDKEYNINIQSPSNKNVPKYTALNHELSHLIFDTFMGGTSKQYFSKKKEKLPEGYDYNDYASELYDYAANVLEDERCESKLGDVYIGTGKRFDTCKEKLGKALDYESPDPCSALLAQRCGRADLIPKEWRNACKEAIDGVRMTDKYGLLLVGDKFIDTVLNPWLIENGKKIPKKDGNQPDDSVEGRGNGKLEKSKSNSKEL